MDWRTTILSGTEFLIKEISSIVVLDGTIIPLELHTIKRPWHFEPKQFEKIIGKSLPNSFFSLKSAFFGKVNGTIQYRLVNLR